MPIDDLAVDGTFSEADVRAAIEVVEQVRRRLSRNERFWFECILSGESARRRAKSHGITEVAAAKRFGRGLRAMRQHFAKVITEVYGDEDYQQFLKNVSIARMAGWPDYGNTDAA